MVSGLYLGELARLAVVELAMPQGHQLGILSQAHSIDTAVISDLQSNHVSPVLDGVHPEVLDALKKVGAAIIERSAAVASAALAAVIIQATSGFPTRECHVGIDGSVYTKCFGYKEKLTLYLKKFFPSDPVILDFSEDGSGLGAALVAAAISRGRQVSDREL